MLLCGIFGNVSDDDVHRTVRAAPQLCAPGATVVWTRHHRPPDLTPRIRGWFAGAGFAERSFVAPDDAVYSVGVHELTGPSEPLRPDETWFSFVR